MLKKIVSGGQTGADRAGLDAAIRHSIPHGGWIPKGRLTENGPLPTLYKLQEMTGSSYQARTEQNVIDSDGTVIIAHGILKGGSALTRNFAQQHKKPCLFIDLNLLSTDQAVQDLKSWLGETGLNILNIAGPRASKDPAIYQAVSNIFDNILAEY